MLGLRKIDKNILKTHDYYVGLYFDNLDDDYLVGNVPIEFMLDNNQFLVQRERGKYWVVEAFYKNVLSNWYLPKSICYLYAKPHDYKYTTPRIECS